jgi:hypothetical protein
MTNRDRAERVLKDLDKLARAVEAGAVGCDKLDDKVRMHRTQKDINEARRLMRTRIFEIEDAERYAAKRD